MNSNAKGLIHVDDSRLIIIVHPGYDRFSHRIQFV